MELDFFPVIFHFFPYIFSSIDIHTSWYSLVLPSANTFLNEPHSSPFGYTAQCFEPSLCSPSTRSDCRPLTASGTFSLLYSNWEKTSGNAAASAVVIVIVVEVIDGVPAVDAIRVASAVKQ